MKYRELTIDDIPTLKTVDGSLTSNSKYSLIRSEQDSTISYQLKIEQGVGPFNFPANYSCEEGDENQYRVMLSDSSGWGWIVSHNSSVVAFCLCQEQSVTNSFYIEGLFVDRSVRGQGLGKRMIDIIITETKIRNLRNVWLKTENNNMPACMFYQHCGFRIIGIKENHAKDVKGRRWDFGIFWGLDISE